MQLKEQRFNAYIDRCAFPVGWGANAAFGHCGPGEYNKKVVQKNPHSFIVEYETGVKRTIHRYPHFVEIHDHPIKSWEDFDNIRLPSLGPERFRGIQQDIQWVKRNGEWTVAWTNGFCDDLGSEGSMLVDPEMYREFILPWHVRLCKIAHNYGVVVHMHSHGAIAPIAADIAGAGIDILNPLDPDESMGLDTIRERVGPRMVLCGGLNKHFSDWNKDDQARHLEDVIEKGRTYGPHILMDSGGVPENVTKDDFEWFLRVSAEIRHKK